MSWRLLNVSASHMSSNSNATTNEVDLPCNITIHRGDHNRLLLIEASFRVCVSWLSVASPISLRLIIALAASAQNFTVAPRRCECYLWFGHRYWRRSRDLVVVEDMNDAAARYHGPLRLPTLVRKNSQSKRAKSQLSQRES